MCTNDLWKQVTRAAPDPFLHDHIQERFYTESSYGLS